MDFHILTILVEENKLEEADLNANFVTMVETSGGFSYKIKDPPKASVYQTSPLPFDGFGSIPGFPFCWEGKFSKSLESFNFKSAVKPHQWDNLKNAQAGGFNSLVVWAYWIPRKAMMTFAFSLDYLLERIEKGKGSFWAKEIQTFEKAGLGTDLMGKKATQVDFKDFIQKIIRRDV